MAARVVLAQKDPSLRRIREDALRLAGFDVAACGAGDEVLGTLERGPMDAAILGVPREIMPFSRVCRATPHEARLLVVVEEAETEHVVDLLKSGADDVAAEPLAEEELVARVEALVRRRDVTEEMAPLRVGDVTIDRSAKRVFLRGREIELSGTERDLILVLAREPATVFSREQLLEDVWGLGFDTGTCLTQAVKRLRRKLEDPGSGPRVIVTVRGWGYRLGDQ